MPAKEKPLESKVASERDLVDWLSRWRGEADCWPSVEQCEVKEMAEAADEL